MSQSHKPYVVCLIATLALFPPSHSGIHPDISYCEEAKNELRALNPPSDGGLPWFRIRHDVARSIVHASLTPFEVPHDFALVLLRGEGVPELAGYGFDPTEDMMFPVNQKARVRVACWYSSAIEKNREVHCIVCFLKCRYLSILQTCIHGACSHKIKR